MNETGIAPFAWVFMLVSMGTVTVLMIYCFARILRGGHPLSSDREAPGGPAQQP